MCQLRRLLKAASNQILEVDRIVAHLCHILIQVYILLYVLSPPSFFVMGSLIVTDHSHHSQPLCDGDVDGCRTALSSFINSFVITWIWCLLMIYQQSTPYVNALSQQQEGHAHAL